MTAICLALALIAASCATDELVVNNGETGNNHPTDDASAGDSGNSGQQPTPGPDTSSPGEDTGSPADSGQPPGDTGGGNDGGIGQDAETPDGSTSTDADEDEVSDDIPDIDGPDGAGNEDTAQEDTSDTSDPTDPQGCRAHADCTGPGELCHAPGAPPPCGPCVDYGNGCGQLVACAVMVGEPSRVCAPVTQSDCSCDDSIKICKDVCESSSDCDEGESCNDQGICAPSKCSADGSVASRTCPPNFACTGTSPAADREDSNQYCERLECNRDDDCGTQGVCVLGQCYSDVGSCAAIPPA